MHKVVTYLREFWKEDFHFGTYLATVVFLTFAIIFNYAGQQMLGQLKVFVGRQVF